jgi:hypothetical protein
MNDWKSMDSAPRDGRKVLLFARLIGANRLAHCELHGNHADSTPAAAALVFVKSTSESAKICESNYGSFICGESLCWERAPVK